MREILAAIALAALGCGDPGPRPPNLLLITVDTLRADRLECYGGPPEVGTHICALADEGTRYLWGVSTAPATAPAITSLLTGLFPGRHGVSQIGTSALDERTETVAEQLAAAGYETGAVVSNPVLHASRGLDQGFAHYDARMTRREPNRPTLRERAAAKTTSAALEFVRGAREPWFLWVHYQDPHGPYAPPGATPPVDRPGDPPLPIQRHQSGYGGIPAYQELTGVRTARAYEQAYVDEIVYLDGHVGELLTAVETERPFVILTSDHGEAIGEDGYWFAHGHSLALDQVHVPLLVRPDAAGARRVEARPVSTASVAATLLAEAGLPVPRSLDAGPLPGFAREGTSGEDPPAPAAVVAEHPHRLAVVVGGQYYARDREDWTAGVRDPVSGGVVWPLSPRALDLGKDGKAATAPGATHPLEKAWRARASSHRATAADASDDPAGLPKERRRALEALGYLE